MTYKYCSHEGCNLPLKLPKSVDVMFGWFCAKPILWGETTPHDAFGISTPCRKSDRALGGVVGHFCKQRPSGWVDRIGQG